MSRCYQFNLSQSGGEQVNRTHGNCYIHDFYLADLNADGLDDLLLKAEYENNRFIKTYPYIFLQQQSGVFLPAYTSNLVSLSQLSGLVTGDFNGDGKADITGILSQRYLVTYLGK